MKTGNDIRQSFLDFFKARDHQIMPGSSLVPSNDPTLLFTNAGMVQFKDVFLGDKKFDYKRVATVQRCLRAGGKHNDLDNVGYTARHHTFFEMLGNFSFGDYFKREAITYAWEYLTEVLEISRDKLWVTVFKDDDEAADIWLKEIGVSSTRFSRCGEEDNFWSMGDTGPCGPCSEIFYDHGEHIPGGPPGSKEAALDRYVEIWNLVFTQYERDADGALRPIPHPSVDTGMGLERITAVMQNVHNNYDIDLFQEIIQAIKHLAGKEEVDLVSVRVVADHIRACAFLISDGVAPSNEGRGYVLRRIIRRAIRHGCKIGFKDAFLYQLTDVLSRMMESVYPELMQGEARIKQVLLDEEKRFSETLEQGLQVFDGITEKMEGSVIRGEDVFLLYDTCGFPVDLTVEVARERHLTVDMDGFNKAMARQRRRARATSKFDQDIVETRDSLSSAFTGYERKQQKTTIIALYQDGRSVKSLRQGDIGGVILLETPFYAQSGGQIGDRGELFSDAVFFEVEDTKKQGKSHIHLGVLRTGALYVGDVVNAAVDKDRRMHITRNHSATHLLHAALRKILGDHVLQKGSLVADDRLRFDFSHDKPLSQEQVIQIERLVNIQILNNQETEVRIMSLENARASSATLLFGEKYEDTVRVLNIGDTFSRELCGGTHVRKTGDIGLFKIISEAGVASGVRRVEAVTGLGALDWADSIEAKLAGIAEILKTDIETVDVKLTAQLEKMRKMEKELAQFRDRLALSIGAEIADEAETINGIKVIAKILEGADPKILRDTMDQLKNKLGTAALVLAAISDSRVSLVAGVTHNSTDRINAGDLVNFVARQVGGKGGGRPDMAQAGGNNPAALEAALQKVPDWIRERLAV